MITPKELSHLIDMGNGYLLIYAHVYNLAKKSEFVDISHRELADLTGLEKTFIKKRLLKLNKYIEILPRQGNSRTTLVVKKKQNNKVDLKYTYDQIDLDIAELILSSVKANNKKALNLSKVKIQDWATDIQKLQNALDDYDIIKRVVKAIFKDHFWSQVIQSTSGLIKHWDKCVKLVDQKTREEMADEVRRRERAEFAKRFMGSEDI